VSPTVFRKGGFRFFFFSRQEPRVHIHVQHATGEAKFWIEPSVSLAQNYGLTDRRVAIAIRYIREHESEVIAAWKAHLAVEVGNVSKHGFWLLIGEREHFLPFAKFPWFRDVPIGHLLHVELPHPHHLYWPDIDVDLAVDSIEHPEAYPLISRDRPNTGPPPRPRKAPPKTGRTSRRG